MILNNVEEVISALMREMSAHAGRVAATWAQKGLDIISSLQSCSGVEKWIESTGQLTLTIHHAPRLGVEGKRAMPQVLIDPRHPDVFGEIKYLIPFENRPWEYLGGRAKDIPAAIAMINDALACCEQRAEHLYVDLHPPPKVPSQPSDR